MYSTNRTYREQTLPAVVQRHLCKVLGESMALPRNQQLRQVGAIRLTPAGPWRSFRATETVDLVHTAFRWTARVRIAPLTWIQAIDECTAGSGSVRCRMWGRWPTQEADGNDMAIGQAMRYLAELAWTPHAMVSNTALRWREITESRVEVSTRVGDTRICVRLGFDRSGRLITAQIPDRPRLVNGRMFRTPWQATFGNYQKISGLWIPAYAEAAWQLPEGLSAYWRGAIIGADLD